VRSFSGDYLLAFMTSGLASLLPGRRGAAGRRRANAATALKSVVVDPSTYGWAGDTPLGRPFAKTIIYE
jgi:glycogen operon protein